jgi:beta-lactamase class A
VFGYVGSALVAAVAGFAAGRAVSSTGDEVHPQRQYDSSAAVPADITSYTFVNPLLECEHFHPAGGAFHVQLRSRLQRFVDSARRSGRVSHISVYFRQLNDGPWIGIDENHEYSPASLLKVPLMMAVLREAEANPALLDQRMEFAAATSPDVSVTFRDEQIEPGKSYTVNELVTRMIRYSDNEAAQLLGRLVGAAAVERVTSEIGVGKPGENLSGNVVSVREYAAVFRVLYNATYLSRAMSDKALGILATSTFAYGMRRGLPDDVRVAHKFGERSLSDSVAQQLHDCGIVYPGASPYLLCIMTQGSDPASLAEAMGNVSRMVFESASREQR